MGLTAVVTIASVGLLLGALSLLNGQLGFSSCSGAAGCGWIVPLIAAVVIGGALWFLSGDAASQAGDEDDWESAACPECGERLLPTWRLCPACGARNSDAEDE